MLIINVPHSCLPKATLNTNVQRKMKSDESSAEDTNTNYSRLCALSSQSVLYVLERVFSHKFHADH